MGYKPGNYLYSIFEAKLKILGCDEPVSREGHFFLILFKSAIPTLSYCVISMC